MPKRKRTANEDPEAVFEKFTVELFRALKTAKGFERQRLAKRSRDEKVGQEKIDRVNREISVLKSLDLQHTAQVLLCAAVLKVKAASESQRLPQRIKRGISKPVLPEEERVAFHNVTSALGKRKQVRDVLSKAVPAFCEALGVTPPGSKSKVEKDTPPAKKSKKEHADAEVTPRAEAKPKSVDKGRSQREEQRPLDSANDISDSDGEGEEMDERVISRMEAMLGGSSSEDEGDKEDDSMKAAQLRRQLADDISLPGTDSEPEQEPEDGSEEVDFDEESSDEDEVEAEAEESDAEDEEDDEGSDSESQSISPPPAPKTRTTKQEKKTKTEPAKASAFLPSLMGGYISGSESASDVDVAPAARKNRRGQQARQAIWEKKHGAGAKHIAKAKAGGGGGKKRDAGWDAKRGAVEAGAADAKPWKHRGGAQGKPAAHKQGGGDGDGDGSKGKAGREKKRDDAGPLHPSWEAKKKAKQAQANVSFQGKKITFD